MEFQAIFYFQKLNFAWFSPSVLWSFCSSFISIMGLWPKRKPGLLLGFESLRETGERNSFEIFFGFSIDEFWYNILCYAICLFSGQFIEFSDLKNWHITQKNFESNFNTIIWFQNRKRIYFFHHGTCRFVQFVWVEFVSINCILYFHC